MEARAQQLRRRLSGKLHCGIAGDERADTIAKQAAKLPQIDIPVDISTISRAVARTAREATIENWSAGWFQSLMGDHLPPPVTGLERSEAVDVHQLRAGHWSGARSYLQRIGRSPSPITGGCQGCSSDDCRESWFSLCREEPNKTDHLLLRCPALMGRRSRKCLTIHPEPEEIWGPPLWRPWRRLL